jgi:uncharacterized protein
MKFAMDVLSLQKALLNPEIYPDHPEKVGLLETHISLLFFTGAHVYKVKKPVDFGFLDFTSLEKREYFCEQEVTLNRRLAPKIYLGVVKITQDGKRISLDGRGEVVEYAVKMKRMPEELLMNRLLEKGRVTPEMMEAVSEKLAFFYSSAATSDFIKSFSRPERMKQDTDENFEQTEKYIELTLSKDTYLEIQNRTNDFLRNQSEMFRQRIASDWIRDCHGDLRMEHIYWGDEISIYDCIEFNERFRYTDTAADIAFLAMDLDYHERDDLSGHLIRTYIAKSGDQDIGKVLDFYKCYRAYVRGKVESFRWDDSHIPEQEKRDALQRAKQYFHLAQRYALKFKL